VRHSSWAEALLSIEQILERLRYLNLALARTIEGLALGQGTTALEVPVGIYTGVVVAYTGGRQSRASLQTIPLNLADC
jgi:hypothetical protein